MLTYELIYVAVVCWFVSSAFFSGLKNLESSMNFFMQRKKALYFVAIIQQQTHYYQILFLLVMTHYFVHVAF